ncbi:ABC transporter ATP-binding protein [Sporolactobacillus sp. THM19-2]|uniref:ABC transporter ATP-binding protein n=1 Tax=Sporolactobacillus sp. THM19-2 TaxID=2511171 RepID=UPI00102175E5|nr:ABC transporter ATP-binding protein [Sporolactobacillus sp. THM19-2]RYL88126.1 ABC transporter ATP-binding protein [Sporolactobacillus sp. THM19-2]
MEYNHLLEIKNLKVHFSTEQGKVVAVDGVSFYVDSGEILGIVGESGCGKSVTSESIMRLHPEKTTKYEGEILYKGSNLLSLSLDDMRKIRGDKISMIFQDPMSSLNPVYTIGNQIAESVRLHLKVSRKDAWDKAVQLLKFSGIPSPEKRIHEYPHELSGGMRQRVMIALAIACDPELLIADEPTTALDVTTQAQILDLILNLKNEFKMGTIFITHDLGVVAEVCTRVVVMYLGQVIEEADVHQLFDSPLHPYTIGLIQSIPQIDGDRTKKLHTISGKVPSLHHIPKGCRFAPRCPYADDLCRTKEPDLVSYTENHKVKCWHYEKIKGKETISYG